METDADPGWVPAVIIENILGIISGNWTQKKCRHVDEELKTCCVKNKSQKAIKKATF